MKKIIVLISVLFLFASNETKAQKSYFVTAGYGLSRIGMPATKQIIDRYNETRTWLDKKMGKPNPLGGYVFSAGVDKGSYSFSVALNLQKSISTARGTTPGGMEAQRDLKLVGTFYSFNGLWDFGDHWDKDYGLGIHMGAALGGITYSTQVTGDEGFDKIMSADGAGIFFGVFYEHYLIGDETQGIGLRVTPYYKGFPGLNKANMTPLLKELDPVNANVPLDKEVNQHGALGINVELVFRLEWD